MVYRNVVIIKNKDEIKVDDLKSHKRKSTFKIRGKIKIINDKGEVLVEKENLVTTAGKNWMLDLICGDESDVFDYIAVGNNNTAETVADTALVSELARAGTTYDRSISKQITFIAVFGAGTGTGTWREAGIFTAAAAGTILSRVTFSDEVKGAGDTFNVQWIIEIE